ncbi:hypothetical protein Bca52824_079790 [Brassica carinata]|uniref:BHLH domain-containing protein n=1 Tax=Brassica carinata TaxID=52824 RepID=A0A8X7U280_BRACI|nr:hypothetical protein Bca52824_079790 [Brassica carinata]
MGLGWRNDVESLAVKDQDISERARNDDNDCQINSLKWSYHYFDHDQADVHVQIVPDMRKEEENSKKNLTLAVPDEHSETGDHHLHIKDYSDSSYNGRYLRNKHAKPKRRRVQIFSDDESEGFTRKVPLVTRKSSKRRRRDEMISNKMRTLKQLVPNCHKRDKASVLDKTIEYMKNLQLQLQVMSIMGMNPYIPQATLNFGMHNHLLTAMGIAHGLHPTKQTTLSPLIPGSSWPSPPFSNLSFPHSSNQSLFPTPGSSPQCLCGLVPCFPTMMNSMIFITIVLSCIIYYALGGLNPPHTHPRATEKNNGKSPASALPAFNSQLPGTVSVAAALSAMELALPEDVLTKTFRWGLGWLSD